MRDDLANGTIKMGPAAKKYARMTSKQAMTPEWKTNAYIDAAAELTNQKSRQKGFKSVSQGETTTGKHLESAQAIVDRLLNG